MPIAGLTDNRMGFTEIGIIRKGAPKPRGINKPGADLDHFRVVFDPEEVETMKTFVSIYGVAPRAIKILLPFDDIDKCWDAYVEAYTAGGLIYRGDGRRAIHWVDPETGEVKVKNGSPYTACIGTDTPAGYYGEGGKRAPIFAKNLGRLRVIVPELKRLAFLRVVTSSLWDVLHISEQLAGLKEVNGGRLAGIPLTLVRKPDMVSIPMKGKRAMVKKWLIHLEPDQEWARLQFDRLGALALPKMPEAKQIASPTTIDNATGEVEADNADGYENDTGKTWSVTAEMQAEFDHDDTQVDPLTEGIYANESTFKDETISQYTKLVKSAMEANIVAPYSLPTSITAKQMIDRVSAIKTEIERKRNLGIHDITGMNLPGTPEPEDWYKDY